MADSDWVDDPQSNDSDWVDDNPSQEMGLGEKVARGALKTLPAIGSIGGGIIGGLAGGTAGSVIPFAGTAAGATTGGVAGAGLGAAAGESLKNIIEQYALGDEKTREQIYTSPIKEGLIGASAEMGGQLLGKGLSEGAKFIGKKAKDIAENLAVNATGATGVQASKFSDDAGRQLLDRKLVRFGDNAENIANRTQGALDAATSNIDQSLKALDAKGVTASADDIVAQLQNKINSLRKDPSQSGVVRKLEGIIEDIIKTGESNVPISMAEKTKRGFNKIAGNWMDPEVGQAGKETYLTYKNAVEDTANAADPALAKMFEEGKETFGLLKPINEAAERRAFQQNQSPFGQLGDMAAAGTGLAGGGPIGGAATVAAKRLLFPRATSSAAVTADSLSKALLKSPRMQELYKKSPEAIKALANSLETRMSSLPKAADKQQEEVNKAPDKNQIFEKVKGSKYSQVLQNAADKGDDSFNAAHFVLSQRDPEYRQVIEDGEEQ